MKKTLFFLTVLMSIVLASSLTAQEAAENEATVETELQSLPMPVLVQPMLAAPSIASPSFGFSFATFGGDDTFQSLHDPSVMKDLEIVEEQRDEIASIQKDFSQRNQKLIKKLMQVQADQAKGKEIHDEMMAMQKEKNEALSKVLLPHQLERIKEVSRQIQIDSYGGVAAALGYGQLATELDISDKQKKQMAEIQKELQSAIALKTEELRKAAKEKVLAALTPDQRAKLKDLTGVKFKRNNKDWQEHFQRQVKQRKDQAKNR